MNQKCLCNLTWPVKRSTWKHLLRWAVYTNEQIADTELTNLWPPWESFFAVTLRGGQWTGISTKMLKDKGAKQFYLEWNQVCLISHNNRIYNDNWPEWSAIWAEIIRVISKLNKCAAWIQFEITSMISDQNCMTQGSITTLLHPFWNCPNTGLGQFKYFIDAVLSQFQIKFIFNSSSIQK